MSKIAVMGVVLDNGQVQTVGAASVVPLIAAAKKIRETGEFKMGKNSVPVREVSILTNWNVQPVMQFHLANKVR